MKRCINITPIDQTGHNCKIVAIATVDNYFAKQLGFMPIPLHKQKCHPASIRQIAKKKGSLQGELLEIRLFSEILADLGYATELVDVQSDLLTFQRQIQRHIDSGSLIIGCFAVNRITGQPTLSYENNEHAAVLHGYNFETGMLNMTHWGKNRITSIQNFYDSSMLLPEQRNAEYYINIKSMFPHKKYELCSAETPLRRQTIVPSPQSGFRGKLIIIKPPNPKEMVAIRQKLMGSKCEKSSFISQLILSISIGISSSVLLSHFLPSAYLALISALYLTSLTTFLGLCILSAIFSLSAFLIFVAVDKLITNTSSKDSLLIRQINNK